MQFYDRIKILPSPQIDFAAVGAADL